MNATATLIRQPQILATLTARANAAHAAVADEIARNRLADLRLRKAHEWDRPACLHCGWMIGHKSGMVGETCRGCAAPGLSLSECRQLARLARRYWGWSLRRLLNAPGCCDLGYWPKLECNPRWERDAARRRLHVEIADLYDRAQAGRGDPRRVTRG